MLQPDAEPQVPEEPPPAPSLEGEPEPGRATEPAKAAEPEGDHEAKLEHDLKELTAKAETKADFENYRRRAAREAASAQERGVVKLALELLPAVDNLDRALAATDGSEESDTLASGIKLVHKDVIAALARVGIEPVWPQGERFDPQHHEAVAKQPVDGAQTGTIVEVYQRGYMLRDAVLRPARVVVAA